MFVTEYDFKSAISTNERLMTLDVDNGNFSNEIEEKTLDIISRLSEKSILKQFNAYQFLTIVKTGNSTYPERAEIAKAGLRADHDKVEGITWYHPKIKTTDLTAHFYIGTKEGRNPWLRHRVDWDSQYGWLFVNEVSAWYDGEKETLIAGDFERRSTSRVWEWKGATPSDRQITIVRNLADSDEGLLKFTGAQRYEGHTLSRSHKRAVITVLDVYCNEGRE